MQLQPEMWHCKWPLMWMFPVLFFFWEGKRLCFLMLCSHCRPMKRKAATRLSSVLYTVTWQIASKAKLLQPQSLISVVWIRWKTWASFPFPRGMQNSQTICSAITWKGSNEILIQEQALIFMSGWAMYFAFPTETAVQWNMKNEMPIPAKFCISVQQTPQQVWLHHRKSRHAFECIIHSAHNIKTGDCHTSHHASALGVICPNVFRHLNSQHIQPCFKDNFGMQCRNVSQEYQ